MTGNVGDDISVEAVDSIVTKYEKTLPAFPWAASDNDSFEEDTSEVITARLEPNPEIYYEDVQDDDFNIVHNDNVDEEYDLEDEIFYDANAIVAIEADDFIDENQVMNKLFLN